MTSPTLEDMTRLVLGLNTVTENPIDPARLTEAVDLWWPKLHVAFAAIPPATSAPQSRPQSEILAELLDVARSTQQQVARLEEHAPRRGVHPVSGPDLGQGHRDWSDANVTLFVCDFLSRRGIPIDGASTSGSNVLVFLQEPVPEARCDQLRRQLQTTSGLSVGFVQPPTDVPDGPETEVTPMQ
jgi:hypothetical protein